MPEIKPPTNMLGKANPDFPDPAVKRDYLTLNIEQPKVEEPKVEPAPAPTPLPQIKPPEPEPLMTITEGLVGRNNGRLCSARTFHDNLSQRKHSHSSEHGGEAPSHYRNNTGKRQREEVNEMEASASITPDTSS